MMNTDRDLNPLPELGAPAERDPQILPRLRQRLAQIERHGIVQILQEQVNDEGSDSGPGAAGPLK
jgi:hypothetical protein